jgi:DNA (cytosine-5)-methyltransferase 1
MDGLIASPPCQTFSLAGKGAGRRALDDVLLGVKTLAAGQPLPTFDDERTSLVLEPLRYMLTGKYRWAAFEQVPTVLPVWEAMADVLRGEGYSVATGLVYAEAHGVPQTRKRAVLLARWDAVVSLPAHTHSRYYSHDPKRLDPDVPRWVTMAEALGWDETDLVGFLRRADNDDTITVEGVEYRARDLRDAEQPAMAVTGKSRSWSRYPAAMVRNSGPGAARTPRPLEAPAYTIRANGSGSHPSGTEWAWNRPATTIVGSFRPDIVAAPGYRKAGDGPRQNAEGSVQVTIEEAAVLQTFPRDYPWQGSKTARFQQVGNAIPCALAAALLGQVTE